MPALVIDESLLRLMPEHRKKEKRTLVLTLDELIDDYRKLNNLSASDLDFVLMAYRFEHLFQFFLKDFTQKKVKPLELMDLWRMAFASLLSRKEEQLPQLTHAWVEASKKFFGPHTSGLTNAFCRKILREKELVLKNKNTIHILGPSLNKRWKDKPELSNRFSECILKRPEAGIGVVENDLNWKIIEANNFKQGKHLALSKASADWIRFACGQTKKESVKILDACAAPGGKLIASLNYFGKKVQKAYAVEAKFKRLERLKENLSLWNLTSHVECFLYDWSVYKEEIPQDIDIVFADLPCTGLGTLATRPDLLLKDWSVEDSSLKELQKRILNSCLKHLTKNGLLCVSVCSSDPSELLHISQVLNAEPLFRSEVNQENSEEISGWVIIKE